MNLTLEVGEYETCSGFSDDISDCLQFALMIDLFLSFF